MSPGAGEVANDTHQALGMTRTEIRLRTPTFGGTTELEVVAARDVDPSEATQRGLETIGVAARSAYVVRTAQRVIAHAKLTEHDGSALSPRRVQEVWLVLKSRLLSPEDAPAVPG